MKHQQYVLVEFKNTEPFTYKMVSNVKITLEKVVQYFEDTEGFDKDKDSITFVDSPLTINLDSRPRWR
jgi:hypothetical protein